MAEATFQHGDPAFVDYTPASGDLSAGQVVPMGNTAAAGVLIAHGDMANAVEGGIAAQGGVYSVTSLQNNADFANVYWDNTNNKVTSDVNNAFFGKIVGGGGGGANTAVEVLHLQPAP